MSNVINLNDVLIKASIDGDLFRVKDAIKAGAEVRSRNNIAIKRARSNGHAEVVKFLSEKGA